MKIGDRIVWRYISSTDKMITRFGYIDEISTFHYVIKDVVSGNKIKVLQPTIAIVLDNKYNNILDKSYVKETSNNKMFVTDGYDEQ